MMKKIIGFSFGLAWLFNISPVLAQTSPFPSYVSTLSNVSSVSGAEKLYALQVGISKTMTPYQILGAVSGDCTVGAPPSIVCTKTNGVSFVASATTDTTNAANIASGTLSLSRLTLASASFYVGNVSNNPTAVAMSGDCTLANTGVVTCTKTNTVAFAQSAITDTTNAANISTGTLAGARYAAANLASSANGGVTGILPFANHPTGSLDTVLGYWSSTTLAATAVPNCLVGSIQYSTSTHAWSCNSSVGTGNVSNSGTPLVNQLAQWVTATTIKGTPLSSLATISVVKTQTFTSSGTYTPSIGLLYATIECVGAGGGGGGAANLGGTNQISGSSGGAGSYSKHVATAAAIGVSQTVTIGNAGAGGNGAGGNGGNGGATTVGSLCTTGGGGGGLDGTFGVVPVGGSGGGVGSGNMVAIGGANGGAAMFSNNINTSLVGPAGASSFYGAGGGSIVVNTAAITGSTASGFGAGGGAGGTGNNSIAVAGGNGTSGYVVITEFTNQ